MLQQYSYLLEKLERLKNGVDKEILNYLFMQLNGINRAQEDDIKKENIK